MHPTLPETHITREEEKSHIRYLNVALENPRDALILQLYFGLGTGPEHEEMGGGPKATLEVHRFISGVF